MGGISHPPKQYYFRAQCLVQPALPNAGALVNMLSADTDVQVDTFGVLAFNHKIQGAFPWANIYLPANVLSPMFCYETGGFGAATFGAGRSLWDAGQTSAGFGLGWSTYSWVAQPASFAIVKSFALGPYNGIPAYPGIYRASALQGTDGAVFSVTPGYMLYSLSFFL